MQRVFVLSSTTTNHTRPFYPKQMTMTTRPRIYIVASYGGCGSKMMAGWLSQLPPHVAKWTYVCGWVGVRGQVYVTHCGS